MLTAIQFEELPTYLPSGVILQSMWSGEFSVDVDGHIHQIWLHCTRQESPTKVELLEIHKADGELYRDLERSLQIHCVSSISDAMLDMQDSGRANKADSDNDLLWSS
ncbi:MAG: hypothetical protein KDD77_05545 [Caldilineaceae bacterium]|nr:hypothetical protein [Caldilineaceae bacterium]